jgi:phage terminase large subunit
LSSTSFAPRIRVEVPEALEPLLAPARYKGAYGGRGGAKSHFFAEQIILKCYARPIRVVCVREVQNTIKDSVKQLLLDKIAKLGLGAYFDPKETEIRGTNGSLIIFRGMQSYNSDSIKSLEGYDIAWIEEAQTLSDVSLELLRPTIRKPGSEIWASWNPRHRTDAIDKFFRKKPHPDAISVMVNWRDNPWFPEVLMKELEHDASTDPDAADHVWEGGYGVQSGAILGRWLNAAHKEKRIHDGVCFDPDGPGVEITSDIGFRDTAGWWFWQRKIGGFSLLRYVGDSGMEAADWIERLKAELAVDKLPLKMIWLPADAKAKTFATKHTALMQFREGFGHGKVNIVPKTSIADRINAARTVIKRCEFHETNCEKGLDGLRAWEFEFNPDLQIFTKEPLHNWASHPSDGYSYGCQVMQAVAKPDGNKSQKLDRWRRAFDKASGGDASDWKTK